LGDDYYVILPTDLNLQIQHGTKLLTSHTTNNTDQDYTKIKSSQLSVQPALTFNTLAL